MPASFSLPVKIRLAKIDELPFLLNSFSKGMKDMRLAESADRKALTEGARQYVGALFVNGTVLIAEHTEAPTIVGWLGASSFQDKSTLIWTYTKSAYRKAGVCRQLMEHAFGGPPELFGLYHGAFSGHLRRKGSKYAPFAAMMIGRPDQASQNLLEVK